MVCRCSSPAEHSRRRESQHASSYSSLKSQKDTEIASLKKELASFSPDNTKYEILDVESHGEYLLMEVLYPNCSKCSYEGHKLMVFRASIKDVIFWREIDPHFADPGTARAKHQAPAPTARFPANVTGRQHAKQFVHNVLGISLPR